MSFPLNHPLLVTLKLPTLDRRDSLIGGSAAGLANFVGLEAVYFRVAFIFLFAVGGWGVLLYLFSWIFLAAVTYLGWPSRISLVVTGSQKRTKLFGLTLLSAGLMVGMEKLEGVEARLLWPVALVAVGGLISARRITPIAVTGGNRLVHLGVGLLIAGFGVWFLVSGLAFRSNTQALLVAIILGFISIIVVAAPWWRNIIRDVDNDRKARLFADERADIAAHLHDSVLQTLALIQKEKDIHQVSSLARRQERELRNWLDPNRESRTGGSIRGRLDEIISEIEQRYSVNIELVTVGDIAINDALELVLGASREAINNAAKHAGVKTVDVYVEITKKEVQIYIRDKGKGFDLAKVAEDRQGIASSIKGRMHRAGGTVNIVSASGKGTEVELSLALASYENKGA